jgi:4-amino-4-deoxy-L-arabinose transferase-like glycosyltransferase
MLNRVAWAALVAATLVTCVGTLRHDYRDATLVGDQASQLMQAVSLAHGGDLAYDPSDLRHYADATWRVRYREPAGLLFQRHGDGWAFAKPYGYSLVVAPFLRVLGPSRGVAVANTLLLLALLAVCTALLRLRLDGPAVPLTAGALVLVSNVVPYAYVLYVELFTALVVGVAAYGLLRAARDGARWAGLLGFAATGLAAAEKSTLAIALAPLVVVTLVRLPGLRGRLPALAAGALVFALAVVPYWHYSGGHTLSPYGGERYASRGGAVPFSDPPAPTNRYGRSGTDETLSVHYVRRALGESWGDKAQSTLTYVVGRHTGVLLFMPVAVVVAALALLTGRRITAPGLAILGGLLLYALAYVVLFTDNYYGGGQSYGNRYFVQVCPLVAALAAAAPIPSRRLVVGALASILFGLVALWPGIRHPSTAVEHIERTTALQRRFPFESNQAGAVRFRCGVTTPRGPREACVARYDP